jgi:hypothetical protein
VGWTQWDVGVLQSGMQQHFRVFLCSTNTEIQWAFKKLVDMLLVLKTMLGD